MHAEDSGPAQVAGAPSELSSAVLGAVADLSALLRGRFASTGEPFGIPSVPAWRLLARLDAASAPVRPTDLADEMHLTKGALTQMLQTLERRGLVDRTPDPRDGRSTAAGLSDLGRQRLRAFSPLMHEAEGRICEVLDDREQTELLRLLGRIQSYVLTLEDS